MANRSDEFPNAPRNHDILIGWLTVVLAFSIPVYRPWLNLASTIIMVVWIFSGNWRSRLDLLRHHRLTLAILAFLALNLLSLLWSDAPGDGFRYVSKYRYLLLVPMLASSVPEALRTRASAALQIGTAVSVALSIAIVVGVLHIGGAYPGNPSPSMAHLDYTLILALASLMALARVLFGTGDRTTRFVWFGAFAVGATGLVLNIGRSGHLGFGVGLGVLVIFWVRTQPVRKIAVAAVIAGVGFTALWVSSPPALQRLAAAGSEIRAAVVERDFQSNLGGRIAAAMVAGRIVTEHPILGTGPGANMTAFRHLLDTEFPDQKPAIYWYQHFHNQYAQIATELGLIGLLALAWIFFELVRGPYPSAGLQASAWVLAAVFLVGFLGEPFFHKQIPLVAFAVAAGLVSAARARTTAGTEDGERDPIAS